MKLFQILYFILFSLIFCLNNNLLSSWGATSISQTTSLSFSDKKKIRENLEKECTKLNIVLKDCDQKHIKNEYKKIKNEHKKIASKNKNAIFKNELKYIDYNQIQKNQQNELANSQKKNSEDFKIIQNNITENYNYQTNQLKEEKRKALEHLKNEYKNTIKTSQSITSDYRKNNADTLEESRSRRKSQTALDPRQAGLEKETNQEVQKRINAMRKGNVKIEKALEQESRRASGLKAKEAYINSIQSLKKTQADRQKTLLRQQIFQNEKANLKYLENQRKAMRNIYKRADKASLAQMRDHYSLEKAKVKSQYEISERTSRINLENQAKKIKLESLKKINNLQEELNAIKLQSKPEDIDKINNEINRYNNESNNIGNTFQNEMDRIHKETRGQLKEIDTQLKADIEKVNQRNAELKNAPATESKVQIERSYQAEISDLKDQADRERKDILGKSNDRIEEAKKLRGQKIEELNRSLNSQATKKYAEIKDAEFIEQQEIDHIKRNTQQDIRKARDKMLRSNIELESELKTSREALKTIHLQERNEHYNKEMGELKNKIEVQKEKINHDFSNEEKIDNEKRIEARDERKTRKTQSIEEETPVEAKAKTIIDQPESDAQKGIPSKAQQSLVENGELHASNRDGTVSSPGRNDESEMKVLDGSGSDARVDKEGPNTAGENANPEKQEKNWKQPCFMAAMLDLQFAQRLSSHKQQEKTKRKACKSILTLKSSSNTHSLTVQNVATDSNPTTTSSPNQSDLELNKNNDLSAKFSITNQVLCLFHASGCPTNVSTNITTNDLANRSSALGRTSIESGLAPQLLNLLGDPDEFVNRAIQDGATSALMSITPSSMGEVGAALASINDRAENDPVLSKVLASSRNLASSNNSSYSPDSTLKKSAPLGELSTLINTLNPGDKDQHSGKQKDHLQEFNSPVFDIWHTKTAQNIFEIVSEKIAQVSNQLNSTHLLHL